MIDFFRINCLIALLIVCTACISRPDNRDVNQTDVTTIQSPISNLPIKTLTPISMVTAINVPTLVPTVCRPTFIPTSITVITPTPTLVLEIGSDGSQAEAQILAQGYKPAKSALVTLNNTDYEAVVYRYRSSSYLFSDRLLIYKKQSQQKVVIYSYSGQEISISIGDWEDINGDKLPELATSFDNGAIKCLPCHRIYVLQLQPDGQIIDLTLTLPPKDKLTNDFAIQKIVDLNGDGIKEWEVIDGRYEWLDFNVGYGHRIYAWDGKTYRNASSQFPEYYQPKITELTARLKEFGFVRTIEEKAAKVSSDSELNKNELYIGELIELLLAYDNAGKREEGWAIFETYANPDKYEKNPDWWLRMWEGFRSEYEK